MWQLSYCTQNLLVSLTKNMPDLQLGSMLHPALSPSFLEKAISKGNARGRSGLGSYRLQETSCSSTVYTFLRYQNTHEAWLLCLSIKLTVLTLQAHKYANFIPISWSLFQPPMQNLRKLITKQVYSVFDLDLRLPSNEGVVSMQKKNVAQIAALILRRCCTGCQLWIKFSNASALKQVFLQNAQKTKKGNWILQSGLLRACAARLENL